ncbi:MAG: hypothetical protein IK088_03750 [Lachnospiraceae bacterium]|nr:hypothetical protein [Lachnospiraceae bacterium]
MKKGLSVLLALVLFVLALPIMSSAALLTVSAGDLLTTGMLTATGGDLPFEITAPQNVTLARTDEFSDSPTTHGLSYSVPNDLNQFLIGLEEAEDQEAYLAGYGYYEFFVTLQMDWALDDVNDPVSGWHYNEYWDYNDYFGFGMDDEGRFHYSDWDIVEMGLGSNESVQSAWVFRGVPNNERWNGNPDNGYVGVKDQLNPDQYRYDESEETLYIDFNEHTIYARMRFAFWGTKLDGDDRELFAYSDWSNVASAGKDGEVFELPTTLPKPEISNLYLTDEEFNDNPVAAFTLTVPDELAKTAAGMEARNGILWIATQARVKGDAEWTDMSNTDWTIKTGEMKCALLHLVNDARPTIAKDTEIEVRCRYWASGAGLEEDVEGPWSDVLSFGTSEIGGNDAPAPSETAPEVIEPGKPSDCPICHFCSQPLGLCIFIWLLILLLVIIIIVVIIIVAAKKNKKKKQQ